MSGGGDDSPADRALDKHRRVGGRLRGSVNSSASTTPASANLVVLATGSVSALLGGK